MSGSLERRLTLAAGACCLGGIVLFVGLAGWSLLTFQAPGVSTQGVLFDAYIWRVTQFTLLQAGLSTMLSMAFGLPVALALFRQQSFPGRVWILRLMALPLGLPQLVAALGLITIWGRQGLFNTALSGLGLAQPVSVYGLSGILLAHVFFNLPLAVRLLLAGLERIPGESFLLAANLGMDRVQTFRFLEWPAMRGLLPGIAGLIFMLCATSFTIVLTLGGGPAATTIEVAIYQALRFDFDPPRAIVLSLVQIGMTGLLLLVLTLLAPPSVDERVSGRPVRRFDGRGYLGCLSDSAIIVFSALFVLLPLGAVLASGLRSDLGRLISDPLVHRAVVTSLSIAVPSSLVCVMAATLMIRARHLIIAQRKTGFPARSFAGAVSAGSALVLLVPPVVIASGWFLLLRPFGDVSRFAPVLIVLINGLMALPFVYRILDPALRSHQAQTERLSESLGLQGFNRARLVDWPLLHRPLLMALSFAAALSLGDLGAVALFGSQDLVTLPWLLYSRMGSYRSVDAAGIALFLGTVCLLLTIAGTPGRTIVPRGLHE